jgi:isocitrate lyase
MYDGFSDTSKHSTEWVRITKEFLKLVFVGGRREASCPYNRCENRRILSDYEMSAHLTKKGFMSKYLVWHQHGEVQLAVADESDRNDDVDWMVDMVADIDRGYDVESKDPLLEVQSFYRLLATSKEKVHDGNQSYGVQIKVQLLKSVLQ